MRPGRQGHQFEVGLFTFVGGCILVVTDSLLWYVGEGYLVTQSQEAVRQLALEFYVFESLAICMAVGGAYVALRGLRRGEVEGAPKSLLGTVGESLRSGKDRKIGAAIAVAYGIAYLLLSSILVYQPSVDFGYAYGVSSTSWSAAACCGGPGTVPVLVVYLLPAAHLALQVLPLDLLFAFVVPLLVGLNATIAIHAVRSSALRARKGWLGTVGVLVGLFTGCPTCAGIFLAGAVGGLGGTTLAVALAPYQLLFVLVSIPLLVASPLVIASNLRRATNDACRIAPQASA